MEIEEREFHYSPEAPLVGWRLFRVRGDDDGVVLTSAMYHDPDYPRWPEAIGVARCHHDHPAPAPGCRCGIYAAIPGTLDSLPGYLADNRHDADPWVYAEVACSGRVFVDMRGVRAERAVILRIATTEADEATRLVAERYGVPVGDLVDVPEWVRDNSRCEGPPPDDVTLDLDLETLGLG